MTNVSIRDKNKLFKTDALKHGALATMESAVLIEDKLSGKVGNIT